MKAFWRNNSLSIVMLGLFAVTFVGQSITGWRTTNDQRQEHAAPPLRFMEYLRSGAFIEATAENWESEFLQMYVYVIFTAFLLQKGSAESKPLNRKASVDEDPRLHAHEPGVPGPVRRGGWRLKVYENSLSLALFMLFLMSFSMHAIGGQAAVNEQRRLHGQPTIQLSEYVGSAQFWFESLQNWQSEFLSIAAMVLLSIVLRQRGSPESKPVATPHHVTAHE